MKNLMHCLIISLFLISSAQISFSQQGSRFTFEGGLAARITYRHFRGAANLPSVQIINYDAPYVFQRGVNGGGINLGLGYVVSKKLGIVIHENSTYRYAFYYFDQDRCQHCIARTFYWDQSFMATIPAFKQRGYFGGGLTMFSIGKELRYHANGADKVLPLHFNSIDLLVGYPVWKLHLEAKFSYVDHGFPGTIRRTAEIIGGRVYYRLTFDKTKKESNLK